MPKAIKTKYKGPTNTRGSRIIASDEDGNRITISYPYELSGEAVHLKAAQALCIKMGWEGSLIGGGLKNGYVFVFAPKTRIVIACDGGLVQDVCSEYPVEFAMIDYDDDGVEDDRLTEIPQDDGTKVKAYAYTADADVMPDRVNELFKAVL